MQTDDYGRVGRNFEVFLIFNYREDEIGIYDVSIERITRQYLDYLDTFKMLNIELAMSSRDGGQSDVSEELSCFPRRCNRLMKKRMRKIRGGS